MAYNKFIKKDGTVMLDLTDTTVSAETLAKDITAVDKYGNKIIGTLTDSPIPIEVSTEEEMTALLESGEVSSVYKYTGTTGIYENNALYEITEESDPLQGTWVFNDRLDFNFSFSETISCITLNYISNGNNYVGMWFMSRKNWLYYEIDPTDATPAYEASFWFDNNYKTIEIISTYNEISSNDDSFTTEVFLTWLQANATKQPAKSFTKLILLSDLEEITITENGEYSGEYSKVSVDVNTFPTYIATKEKPNDFSKLFYKSTINDIQLNTLMNGLDTSNVTNMSQMFFNCTNLTTIPLLNTSNVTNMYDMFEYCSNLTTIPQLNTSNVTNMGAMFSSCSNLTTIPLLDTSNVTDMESMFSYCTNLTTIPQLDTSNVTNMYNMFTACTNLTSIPQLNTSNVSNMMWMFQGCESLTTIPQLNTSNVTNMEGMFTYCTNLTTIPPLDVSNVENMDYMFDECTNLTSVTLINMENTTADYSEIFYGCTNLKSLIMSGATESFNISYSTQFETQDLVNLIDSLYDFNASGVSTFAMNFPTVYMGSTNLAKLTDEQKAVATAKGWQLR